MELFGQLWRRFHLQNKEGVTPRLLAIAASLSFGGSEVLGKDINSLEVFGLKSVQVGSHFESVNRAGKLYSHGN